MKQLIFCFYRVIYFYVKLIFKSFFDLHPSELNKNRIMNDSKYASTDEGDVLLICEPITIDGVENQEETKQEVIIPVDSDDGRLEPEDVEVYHQPEENVPSVEELVPVQWVSGVWNIDSYRNSFETDEHWELRRMFMDQHKDSIPEEELVALAQAFANSLLLNAVYCKEVSDRLDLLGASIATRYRSSRAHSAAKVTVPASNAVADWLRKIPEGLKIVQRKQLATRLLQPAIPITSLEDVFRNFILLDDNLEDSGREFGMLNCGLFVVRVVSQERKQWVASVTAAGYLLSKSNGPKKKANRACREEALQLLRRKCYKIKVSYWKI